MSDNFSILDLWSEVCAFLPAGDGMNAYMAYRVSTQVFASLTWNIW